MSQADSNKLICERCLQYFNTVNGEVAVHACVGGRLYRSISTDSKLHLPVRALTDDYRSSPFMARAEAERKYVAALEKVAVAAQALWDWSACACAKGDRSCEHCVLHDMLAHLDVAREARIP